jgi:hypothetical protein
MKHYSSLLSLLIWFSGMGLVSSFACDEGMIRDAAFDQPRDIFRLCVIHRADDANGDANGQAIAERLGSWLETDGAAFNLEIVLVAADDPAVRWNDYGLPAAPPELPVVVLVGERPADPHNIHSRQNFFVDYWQPEPTSVDLESLLDSPAREAIRRELVKNLAVIVQVPGSDDNHQHLHSVVTPICQAGFGKQAWGVASVTIDRHDPRERLLHSFLGTQPDGPDWIGVVFGRGKFMTPLEGEAITAAGLQALLTTIAADCTCSQSPSRLGVDLPMRWETADDEAVIRLAPEPLDTDAIKLASDNTTTTPGAMSEQPVLSSVAQVTFWLFGGMIVFAGIGSAAIFWRHSHRDSN